MSGANVPASIGTDSPQTRGLLAALSNLVKPVVYECMSSETKREQLAVDSNSGSREESLEHQFVNCLKAFVAVTVEECRTTESTSLSASNPADVQLPTTLSVPLKLNVIEDTHRPRAIPPEFRDVFKDYVLKKIRSAVSSMPTRLLAFDSAGSQICLVDHRAAIRFLAEIIFAEMDSDSDLEILPDVIKQFKEDPTGEFLNLRSGFHKPTTSGEKILNVIYKYTRYAILSHTWTKGSAGEISYQDWATRERNPSGYSKITRFCEASARDCGFRLGWVDTCCINKESSAELDEAIRSMYRWYRKAALCVVYLSETNTLDEMARDSWFTRGWTLQELVASRRMAVYNKHWTVLDCGQNTVAAIADIHPKEIQRFRDGLQSTIPISRRLQMACGRQVTREEDKSYSLMGILDISIPIAYGEGARRAFSRLMRELINTNRGVMDIFNRGYYSGIADIIPSTVDVYRGRSNAFDYHNSWYDMTLSKLTDIIPDEPFLLTHVGLRIHLLLVPALEDRYHARFKHKFQPLGGLYGHVWNYVLLDKELDSGKDLDSYVLIFGIVNFSMVNGKVTIQNPALSIPLSCSGQNIGRIESYTNLTTCCVTDTSVPVLKLRYLGDPDEKLSEITLPGANLMLHGLSRKMLYL